MASLSIIGIRGWGNLRVPCQAPLDCLRPLGAVSGRLFYAEVPYDIDTVGLITGGFSHEKHGQFS
jgi:hypothetical protein